MSRANVKMTLVERVRVTGLYQDVRDAVDHYYDEGFRCVRGPNALLDGFPKLSATRSGATLERVIELPSRKTLRRIVSGTLPELSMTMLPANSSIAEAAGAPCPRCGIIDPRAVSCAEAQARATPTEETPCPNPPPTTQ